MLDYNWKKNKLILKEQLIKCYKCKEEFDWNYNCSNNCMKIKKKKWSINDY